jgi:lipoprotein NlpD
MHRSLYASARRSFALSASALVALTIAAGCTTSVPAPVVDRNARPVVVPQPEARPTPPVATVPVNPAVPGNTAGSQFHVVQRGETLYGIARSNNVDLNALASWNGIAVGQPLRDGQVLRLSPPLGSAPAPTATGTVVTAVPSSGAIQGQPLPATDAVPGAPTTPGLTPIPGTPAPTVTPIEAPLKREPKSQRLPYSDAALATMQRGEASPTTPPTGSDPRGAAPGSAAGSVPVATAPATAASAPATSSAAANTPIDIEIKPGSGVERDGITWGWPTSGKVASKFNDKAPMKGIDIAANAGTAVVAAATGKVIYVGKEPRGYGQMVVVSHAKETVSVYFHTDKVLVKEQQRVLLGQKLAEVSDAASNKMHFEVRRQGRPLDPISLMPR